MSEIFTETQPTKLSFTERHNALSAEERQENAINGINVMQEDVLAEMRLESEIDSYNARIKFGKNAVKRAFEAANIGEVDTEDTSSQEHTT